MNRTDVGPPCASQCVQGRLLVNYGCGLAGFALSFSGYQGISHHQVQCDHRMLPARRNWHVLEASLAELRVCALGFISSSRPAATQRPSCSRRMCIRKTLDGVFRQESPQFRIVHFKGIIHAMPFFCRRPCPNSRSSEISADDARQAGRIDLLSFQHEQNGSGDA